MKTAIVMPSGEKFYKQGIPEEIARRIREDRYEVTLIGDKIYVLYRRPENKT